ncbi:MAG: hypothetical protein ACREUZ_20265 [Burkholderiales bacterium]
MRTESFSNPESTGGKIPRTGIGSADFLLLEARTAEAYLDMAQRSFDGEVQRRSVSRARRALTAMTYFLAESAGADEDAQLIRRVRDDLRARLSKMTRP